ncbi:MAG: response regulator [Desulfobacterales bacterium]|nr:response regulator [Desulfobacterales bacterium]MDX2508244.1 response regulator [Desulfobacterales bacterium]
MNKKKILIVDDDNAYLNVLQKIFSKMEYEAEFAGSSKEALEILKKESFPLIITDLEMPGLDGVELCKQIKKIDSKSIVYALSGYITEYDTENLEKSGFDGYLSKPIKIEVLQQAIEGAFDKLEDNK